MIIFPSSKINLGLNILEKREDNYHNIESVFVEIPCFDILELIENQEEKFTTSGLLIEGKDNLVIRAKNEFATQFSIPKISIHLYKNIPMGAGLGGGSSDAAFLLKMLRDYFHPTVSNVQLKEIASKIGSDCSFFIEGKTQIATGRGEILNPIHLDLGGYYLLLINLGIHVSTQEAYASVIPNNTRNSISAIIQKPIKYWKDELTNDFEIGVFSRYPELAKAKLILYENGAEYASMTGSGSTIFGIFKSKPEKIQWPFPVIFEQLLRL